MPADIDSPLITSAQVRRIGGHDRVRVYNRGALCGELLVCPGDGAAIARRLVPAAHVSESAGVTYFVSEGDGS